MDMIYLAMVIVLLQFTRGNPLIFPGETPASKLNIPQCSGDTFCESGANYPKKELQTILKSTHLNVDLFNTGNATGDDELNPRFGDNEGVLCTSIRKTIFPDAAQNVRKEWRLIFNGIDNFRQGVRVEICRNQGPCKLVDDPTVVTQCKQKYIERRLLAVDSLKTIIVEDFLLPAGCVCTFKSAFFHRFKTKTSYKSKYKG